MKKAGRKVDLSNINISEIELWIKNSVEFYDVIKCQSIISLHNGAQMQEVCNVLGITRETIRLWKERLRKGGVNELLKKGKVGKRSRLTNVRLNELKKVIKVHPTHNQLEGEKWTGKLVQNFAYEKWNLNINIRTAHQWFNKAKQ